MPDSFTSSQREANPHRANLDDDGAATFGAVGGGEAEVEVLDDVDTKAEEEEGSKGAAKPNEEDMISRGREATRANERLLVLLAF